MSEKASYFNEPEPLSPRAKRGVWWREAVSSHARTWHHPRFLAALGMTAT